MIKIFAEIYFFYIKQIYRTIKNVGIVYVNINLNFIFNLNKVLHKSGNNNFT